MDLFSSQLFKEKVAKHPKSEALAFQIAKKKKNF